MICQDTYKKLLASVAPKENAARLARDGSPGYKQGESKCPQTVEEKTYEMMRAMIEPTASNVLAERVGITAKSVANRMHGLKALGWVRMVGRANRPETGGIVNVWALTEAGREKIGA